MHYIVSVCVNEKEREERERAREGDKKRIARKNARIKGIQIRRVSFHPGSSMRLIKIRIASYVSRGMHIGVYLSPMGYAPHEEDYNICTRKISRDSAFDNSSFWHWYFSCDIKNICMYISKSPEKKKTRKTLYSILHRKELTIAEGKSDCECNRALRDASSESWEREKAGGDS